jgi:Fe-S-cluster containining protein
LGIANLLQEWKRDQHRIDELTQAIRLLDKWCLFYENKNKYLTNNLCQIHSEKELLESVVQQWTLFYENEKKNWVQIQAENERLRSEINRLENLEMSITSEYWFLVGVILSLTLYIVFN